MTGQVPVFSKLSKIVTEHEKQITELLRLLEVDNLHNAIQKVSRLVREEKARNAPKKSKLSAAKFTLSGNGYN